jgi:hypothetical protein
MLVLRHMRQRLPVSRRHTIQLAAAAERLLEAQSNRASLPCLGAINYGYQFLNGDEMTTFHEYLWNDGRT